MHRFLRTLIPSFRFFNDAKDEPLLWVRARFDSEWQNALIPPPLPWYGLLLNPEWGMHHALCNATQQLIIDLAGLPGEITELASFRQVRFLLFRKMGPRQLEFRIELSSEEVVQARIEA
jgi:hypothetical protein